MSRRIVIRQAARADLEQIWLYTLRIWGKSQADLYISELEAAFTKAAEQPAIGSDRGYVRPGLRKLNVGSHAIFYFYDGASTRISRILHDRQDSSQTRFE